MAYFLALLYPLAYFFISRNPRKETIRQTLGYSFLSTGLSVVIIVGSSLLFSIIFFAIMPYQYDEHYVVTESYNLAITERSIWIQGDDMSFQKLHGDFPVIGEDTCKSPKLETHKYYSEKMVYAELWRFWVLFPVEDVQTKDIKVIVVPKDDLTYYLNLLQ